MPTTTSEIRLLREAEIMEFWKSYLWKDRKDPIRPMSSMLLDGGTDIKIYRKFYPYFMGIFVDGQLVGCNSCHASSQTQMRSRGLFVMEGFRGQGLAQKLFQATEDQALREEKEVLWSYPRKSSFGAYGKFGFKFYRDCPQSPDHCYAWKPIDSWQERD